MKENRDWIHIAMALLYSAHENLVKMKRLENRDQIGVKNGGSHQKLFVFSMYTKPDKARLRAFYGNVPWQFSVNKGGLRVFL